MKKHFLLICTGVFFTVTMFAQTYTENTINFVKGNISDKISAVKQATGTDIEILSIQAVDFVLANIDITGVEDRDINTLAVTGVLAIPVNEKDSKITLTKLYKLFSFMKDSTIRISIIDKIVQFYQVSPSQESVKLITAYLESCIKLNQVSEVEKAAIVSLGKIGDGTSFSVLYQCLNTLVFAPFKSEIHNSMENIADKALAEILTIISTANIDQVSQLFNLIKNSDKISSSFKSEIAENVLSDALSIIDSDNNKDDLLLEYEAFNLITENNWTRASSLIIEYFNKSKQNFNSGLISEAQFTTIITGVSKVAKAEAAKALSEYLGELNKEAEIGKISSEALLLTLISALGDLGSKTAFDYLLYVTYLDYPETVIAEARTALTKLKW